MLGEAARLYAGLGLLALMCVATLVPILAGAVILPRARREPFARRMISTMFRLHLGLMCRMGALRLDLRALDALRDAPGGMLIAPNHPSMIDAALVLSRLPDLTCVMKSDILGNPLFGLGARKGGYIANHPPRSMLRAAVARVREGRHLLLFPEGTRTLQRPLNPLPRTVGVIARHAGVPVQTVIIETRSNFLGKRWPLTRVPSMPLTYTARLGRRFDPPSDADAFTAELEAYFHGELTGASPPAAPSHPASR